MSSDEPAIVSAPESRMREVPPGDTLLLQLRQDRRLGHEWDDWDGAPLPDDGVFDQSEGMFFRLMLLLVVSCAVLFSGLLWLAGPRLSSLGSPITGWLGVAIVVFTGFWLIWLVAIALVLRTGRNRLPARLAERGLLPWVMPKVERTAAALGMSRDRAGNATVRVFNRVSIARKGLGISPGDLLILLPRCLGKEAMQAAMGVSARYGIPLFVAARGRYARQMIALRRPKGIVAVACERDLVSGVHDVAKHLPVLGTTLQLADGPCRNTAFSVRELEEQVRRMLGLEAGETGIR